jgi:DNA-binding NarL/FixJ family response regulator
VVLLDVHLPGGGGRAVLDAVLATRPGTRFLALSVSDAAEDVIGVIRGGARGYVVKAISGPELCEAIQRVHAGDAYFSPRLAGFVLDAFRGDPPVPLDPRPACTSPPARWRPTCPPSCASSSSPTGAS